MTQAPKDQSWMKNHPLEGDNVVTGLYNVLAKRNPKTMKACHGIRIPDTVVFEHNFPRGWYATDMKANEVVRKQGRELDANTIEQGFTQDLPEGSPIAGRYLCTVEAAPDAQEEEVRTLVEVFNNDTLAAFLARRTKPDGVLQKFILPKGFQNSVIKAVWSPRVCMVQRRTNKYRILDRKRAECDPFSITVTYEGPTFLSEEGSVSANIAVEVKELCGNIVQHFFYTEHKYITRMVLYFKADQRDRLWLLWCGSLRVSDRETPSEMPVNLITNFTEPTASGSTFSEDRLLRKVDVAFHNLTGDQMFYGTYMKPMEGIDIESRNPSTTVAAQAANGQDSPRATVTQAALSEKEVMYDWTNAPPLVTEARDRILDEKEVICSLFEDIFYRARNHFLTSRNVPYDMTIPQRARDALTENGVVDLMRTLRVPSRGQQSEGSTSMTYVITPAASQPLTQLSDKAQEWIAAFFESKLRRLQNSAAHFSGDLASLEAEVQAI